MELRVVSTGQAIPVAGERWATIGRASDNDLVLLDSGASPYHALIRSVGTEGAVIQDRGKTQGTFVNGRRIEQQQITIVIR